ncbi:hypothetical protein C8R47DRAFT_635390 [Mycena vitilis]|nr:hypothetical protein C8R47DRAFT_635390 [Mycena vitilis]
MRLLHRDAMAAGDAASRRHLVRRPLERAALQLEGDAHAALPTRPFAAFPRARGEALRVLTPPLSRCPSATRTTRGFGWTLCDGTAHHNICAARLGAVGGGESGHIVCPTRSRCDAAPSSFAQGPDRGARTADRRTPSSSFAPVSTHFTRFAAYVETISSALVDAPCVVARGQVLAKSSWDRPSAEAKCRTDASLLSLFCSPRASQRLFSVIIWDQRLHRP